MKNLIKFLLLLCFPLMFRSYAQNDNGDIPHYRFYMPTPIVNYTDHTLDFYSVKDAYGEFSNFALFPIKLDGVTWPSSEHYFQAQKFLDESLKERVRNARSPYLAAKIGRDPNLTIRDDWKDIRDSVMLKALRAKFMDYEVLRRLLLSTQQAYIYEHTVNDCYWGDCGDRTGKNRLGELLMQIREELKKDIFLND